MKMDFRFSIASGSSSSDLAFFLAERSLLVLPPPFPPDWVAICPFLNRASPFRKLVLPFLPESILLLRLGPWAYAASRICSFFLVQSRHLILSTFLTNSFFARWLFEPSPSLALAAGCFCCYFLFPVGWLLF